MCVVSGKKYYVKASLIHEDRESALSWKITQQQESKSEITVTLPTSYSEVCVLRNRVFGSLRTRNILLLTGCHCAHLQISQVVRRNSTHCIRERAS